MNIPKIIHYCWFGKNPKPEIVKKCIESWKKYCPDYEIIEWNEDNFDVNINSYVKEAYDNKKWAFVTDYVRLWILYNYGGIYFDTDVEIIKNIDDLLSCDVFLCSEDNYRVSTGLGIGAKKKNAVVKKMLDDYKDIHFLKNDGTFDVTTCRVRNTESIKDLIVNLINHEDCSEENGIRFYPPKYFCPYNFNTGELKITNDTYAIHWYSATWLPKRIILKKKIARIIRRIFKLKRN